MNHEETVRPNDLVRLRRSVLFVPGAEPRKLAHADSSGADSVVFDLEDSVDLDSKERARDLVAEKLSGRGGRGGRARSEWLVRVNGCDTPYFERDVLEVAAAGARSIMLPKSCPATLARARLHLASVEQQLGIEADRLQLLGLVETANGIVRLPKLLSEPTRLDALCFGNVDFGLDMGLPDGDLSSGVVYHARCSLAITAAALGVSAIDGVCLDIRNDERFESEARAARGLGFSGKLCIHPAQVALANSVFTPSPEEIEKATRVVDASHEAAQEGVGVFTLDGQMVDAPVLALQMRVLERARRAGVLNSNGIGCANEEEKRKPTEASR